MTTLIQVLEGGVAFLNGRKLCEDNLMSMDDCERMKVSDD